MTRFEVLTSGPRDIPARQQTLRATIDWSHSLLAESEQRLFRRLAVFAGGFTFADVEAVCAEPGASALDELESLVEKALVQTDRERLRMLQTIGEYAREHLDGSGEAQEIALRHAHRYAAIGQEIRDGIEGIDQIGAIARGIAEEAQSAGRARHAPGDRAGRRCRGVRGRHAVERRPLLLLAHPRQEHQRRGSTQPHFSTPTPRAPRRVGRAGALITAGLASWMLGQLDRSKEEHSEAYRIATKLGADRERCVAAFLGPIAMIGLDLEVARELAGDAVAHSRERGLVWAEGFASSIDGIVRTVAGDVDAAHASYTRALEVQQQLADEEGAGLSLGGLAQLAAMRGDLSESLDLYRRSLERSKRSATAQRKLASSPRWLGRTFAT